MIEGQIGQGGDRSQQQAGEQTRYESGQGEIGRQAHQQREQARQQQSGHLGNEGRGSTADALRHLRRQRIGPAPQPCGGQTKKHCVHMHLLLKIHPMYASRIASVIAPVVRGKKRPSLGSQ